MPIKYCIGAVHTKCVEYVLKASSIDIHYHNYYVFKLVHLEQNMSARSEIFTNKGVKNVKQFFSNY